jgi:carbon-monoxide dehydrogenase large subunit
MGAYLRLITPGVPALGAFMFPAIYKFPAYRFECDGVFTNKVPTDAYRGAGGPRRRSPSSGSWTSSPSSWHGPAGAAPQELDQAEEFPFTTVAGLSYDSGDYETATQQALELIGYDELRAEQRRRRESNDPVQLGIGFSTFTEMCGLAPSRVLGSLSYGAGGWEHASIRMLPTGKVEVVSGSTPHGQGHETAWSQLVADRLGVPFEDIEVLHGDTSVSPRGPGHLRVPVAGGRWGRGGQRGEKVVAKARRVAAHLLEASEDDLDFSGGKFSVRGTPGSEVSIQEIALATFAAHNFPEGVEPSIDADATFDPENFSFPHGTHICAMEVDTETGMAKIRKYACVDDVGTIVNPLIVEGQIHGGLAQGIAQALFEEAVYDADGNLTTGSFVDYLVPSAADLPHFDTGNTVHAARATRSARRASGRPAASPAPRPVVNAALDAVRHLGVQRHPDAADPRAGLAGTARRRGRRRPCHRGTNAYGGAQTESTAGVSTPASSLGGDR